MTFDWQPIGLTLKLASSTTLLLMLVGTPSPGGWPAPTFFGLSEQEIVSMYSSQYPQTRERSELIQFKI